MKPLLAALLGSTLIIAPIQVVDGDTVRAGGQVYRLVGFDTPENGDRAQCSSERLLAARATARLQALIAAGKTELEQVRCSVATVPGSRSTVATSAIC